MTNHTNIKTILSSDAFVAATEVNRSIGGSVIIEYDGFSIIAPARDIHEAMEDLRDVGHRRRMMAAVYASLAGSVNRMKAGRAPRKVAKKFSQDLVIWFANQVLEGRSSVNVQ